jgi:murein DD-endopeptidase MepM/ murein hydrolase activator NlpD
MTAMLNRAILIAALAAALAACGGMRSQYAPYPGYKPPAASEPVKPAYPIHQESAPTPAPTAGADQGEPDRPKAAPTAPVEAQTLPPASAAAGSPSPSPQTTTPAPTPTPLPPATTSELAGSTTTAAPPPAQIASRKPQTRTPAPTRAAPPPVPLVKYTAQGRVESAGEATHTVVVGKGDTVNILSTYLLTPKEAIIRANKLKKPYELEVGRSLKIPTSRAYVVRPGDTLYAVGRRFSVPVAVLAELNNFSEAPRLHPGQKVDLPTGYVDNAAAEVASRTPPSRRRAPVAEPSEQPTEPAVQAALPPRGAARQAAAPPAAIPSTPVPYASLPGRVSPSNPPVMPPSRGSYPPVLPPSRSSSPPATASIIETAPAPSDTQVAAAGRGRFVWPVRGEILSGFGSKPGGQRNDGLDIAAPMGGPVAAAATGDVVYAGNQVPGFGNLVLIKHVDGWVTAYAHLSATEVKIKDHVSQGAEIGKVGQTGGVDQPQLHFEIRYAPSPRDKAKPVDPALLLGGQ